MYLGRWSRGCVIKRAENVPGIFSVRFRFCVICGEKLKLSPTERARAIRPLTSRQLRARRRTEWQRKLNCGEASWHRDPGQDCPQYPGYVTMFRKEDPESDEREMMVVLPDGEPRSILIKLQNETRRVRVETIPAEDANALEFSTGPPLSRNVDIKGLIDLSKEDFPAKFAHFVALVRIDFAAEIGVDAGGVHREWFSLVTELVIDPSLGVFVCTNHEAQTYFFNVNSKQWIGEEHLAYYFAFGRLVGRALLEGEVMGFHFASALLKVILGIPITFRDYEDLDPVTYKSVKWMLEHNGADKLGLDFTATRRDAVGNLVTVELVPSGGNISVTDENKHEFAERWLRYFLLEAFQISCTCF
ncbi:hypothetical protein PC122_g14922 [Phytophthora cactorum]|nr:hypothetical protein PC122_g14922 [Phytophthora cactorum]